MHTLVQSLADTLSLSTLLEVLGAEVGEFELLHHWKQGEFHHDVVVAYGAGADARVLVVATNCNGGVKEVLAFRAVPERYALWHWRCPDVADFTGGMPELLARTTTTHFFDPCALLRDDARSELLPEHRVRQKGGGWEQAPKSR